MITLVLVLRHSIEKRSIGGKREHPSAQLPLIFLSGRGFSRVPESFLTAGSLSFSLRFSDESEHARECRATKLQDAINEGGSPRSLFCLIHPFLLVSSIWLRQFLYFPRLTTCHTSTHFTGKEATCIIQFVLGLISAVLSGAVLWAHCRNSGSFSRGMWLVIEHRFAWTTLVPSIFVSLDKRSP